ncbi:MAG: hypothetical protein C7B45_13280 [Sulfobacillus acidophilus]|uniref:Asp23/Gls24 family envelope stress response protein n=1 Tax=Sulfobacillus acidophilus TaxID=53633 RepID=A0A2T2WEZ2_9FIRM|nr:MAG: hypothetical protein C7B45_13280 [Sulfobacillus acidophilus]
MRMTHVVSVHGVFVADFTTVCHIQTPSAAKTVFAMVTWEVFRCNPSGKGCDGALEKRTEWGQTIVNDDVLAVIAAHAALTAPGIVQMSQSGFGDNLTNLMHHDPTTRGVRVTALDEGHYAVDLYVLIAYGTRIAAVAREVGRRVNDALKDAVGTYPDRIVIHVDGVRVLEQ